MADGPAGGDKWILKGWQKLFAEPLRFETVEGVDDSIPFCRCFEVSVSCLANLEKARLPLVLS